MSHAMWDSRQIRKRCGYSTVVLSVSTLPMWPTDSLSGKRAVNHAYVDAHWVFCGRPKIVGGLQVFEWCAFHELKLKQWFEGFHCFKITAMHLECSEKLAYFRETHRKLRSELVRMGNYSTSIATCSHRNPARRAKKCDSVSKSAENYWRPFICREASPLWIWHWGHASELAVVNGTHWACKNALANRLKSPLCSLTYVLTLKCRWQVWNQREAITIT